VVVADGLNDVVYRREAAASDKVVASKARAASRRFTTSLSPSATTTRLFEIYE
jgi:hypothetical protein